MTCTCDINGGLGQLPDLNLIGSGITSAFSEAKALWTSLENALGIGAGRREADVITPLQNRILSSFLAPATTFIEEVKGGQLTPTCAQVQQWNALEVSTKTQWLNFLHNTHWTDGRAAQQAEATLQPYFTNIENDFLNFTNQYCGGLSSITGVFTTPTGQLNWPIIALGAGLAYALFKKKS